MVCVISFVAVVEKLEMGTSVLGHRRREVLKAKTYSDPTSLVNSVVTLTPASPIPGTPKVAEALTPTERVEDSV